MLKKIKDLFGVEAPDNAVYPTQEGGVMTPRVDANYSFDPKTLRVVLLWLQPGQEAYKNIYITGPTGAGKTSLVEQVCARLGREVHRVGCHARLEMADLIGRLTLTERSTTEFVPGALTSAMENGAVLLLDEVDQLTPSTAMGLNPILDGGPLYIPETGKWVYPHPDFRVAATGNSSGRGDESGLYRGVQRQNIAWIDRFLHLKVGYLPSEEEEKVVVRAVPELPGEVARAMVRLANEVRGAFIGVNPDGTLESTLSTRVLVKWASLAVSLYGAANVDPMMEGLNVALLNSVPPHEADAIRKMWQRIVGG